MSGWGCVLIKFHLQNLEAYGVDLQAIVCQLPLEIFSDTWGEKKRWKEKRAKAKGKPGHSLASPGATASEWTGGHISSCSSWLRAGPRQNYKAAASHLHLTFQHSRSHCAARCSWRFTLRRA